MHLVIMQCVISIKKDLLYSGPSQISFVQELAKLLKSVYEKNMFV